MSLTKDEVSDLRSHIDRLVQCQIEREQAERQLAQARRNLDDFLHGQQFPPKS